MKKKVIVTIVSAIMLVGGVTAYAASLNPGAGDLVHVDAKAEPSEYKLNNDKISGNWNALTQEQKNFYVNHKNSAPTAFFPFGIDTTVSRPKGYPTHEKAQNPADYPQTAPLPAPIPGE